MIKIQLKYLQTRKREITLKGRKMLKKLVNWVSLASCVKIFNMTVRYRVTLIRHKREKYGKQIM